MSLLLAKIDSAHQSFLMMLVCGAFLLLNGFFGWALGGIPDGNRYHPDLVLREKEPIKFWIMVIFTTVVAVILLVGGAVGLLSLWWSGTPQS